MIGIPRKFFNNALTPAAVTRRNVAEWRIEAKNPADYPEKFFCHRQITKPLNSSVSNMLLQGDNTNGC
jgi:hypothetical protein